MTAMNKLSYKRLDIKNGKCGEAYLQRNTK